jgi:hypothetical protein
LLTSATRGAEDAAVLHHANPVGQIEHVMDIMADQEDADAVGLERPHQLADLRGLLRPERRVGSSMIRIRALPGRHCR